MSESNEAFVLRIEIITLTLVFYRCEVIQDADPLPAQPHVVPQLLPVFDAQRGDSLALDDDMFLAQKVGLVAMAQGSSMETGLEMVFTDKGNAALAKRNLKSILVHVFVQERPQLAVYLLAAAKDVIDVPLQAGHKHCVHGHSFFDGNESL